MMFTVVLAFPPLVETNFGMIYPSTAVLAAYLEQHGVHVRQVDLNAKFLDHVLRDEELAATGDEMYSRARLLSVGAARWTRQHLMQGSLLTSEFTTASGEARNPLDNIARFLVSPYSVDPDRTVLDGVIEDQCLLESYARFFREHLGAVVPGAGERILLGVSVPMGPQLMPALQLASLVRNAIPRDACRIVLGGPTMSLLDSTDLSRLLQKHPAVDCIVRFDGERPLLELAEQVAAGIWVPHKVAGTSSLRDHVVEHVAPTQGPSLNALPTPSYSKHMLASAPNASLGVTQARGCYWGKCDYCDFVEVYKGSPPYRGRRADRVVEDIRALVGATGVRRYRVITESIPPAFARQFSALLCENELNVQWSSFAMVDRRFSADLLRQMAGSGCEFLVIGLESMVTRALKLVHKSADREENIRFVTNARSAGIRLSVNLIPNLPSTTREEAFQGLRDLQELADCMDHVKVFDFETTRSSRVGRSPSSFGLIARERINRVGHAQLALNTLPAEDPAMSGSELAEVFRAYRAFAVQVNARNQRVDQRVTNRSYFAAVDRPEGPVLIDFATMERVEFPPRIGPAASRDA